MARSTRQKITPNSLVTWSGAYALDADPAQRAQHLRALLTPHLRYRRVCCASPMDRYHWLMRIDSYR